MQIKKYLLGLIMMCAASPVLMAQSGSSASIFSPYTLYGIGSINSTAPTFLKSMGGAGVAYSSPLKINTLNPASNSSALPNTFLLTVGGEGGTYYLKASDSKTSGYTVNFSDLAIRFPVYKGYGVSISMTPYSSVGYSIGELDETSYTEVVDYNAVLNSYSGGGGVSQLKLGFGGKIVGGLSLGADLIYYFGTISRTFNTTILTNIEGTKDYISVTSYTTERIGSITGNFGAQYDIKLNKNSTLSFGATYLLGGDLGSNVVRVIPTNNYFGDYSEYTDTDSNFRLPNIITAGASFSTRTYTIVADYSYSAWDGINDAYEQKYDYINFVDTHSIKIGAEYTPNRYNIRKISERMSYRLGFNYSNSYITLYDTPMSDKAITMGVGVPIKQAGISSVNLNVELGQTGVITSELFRQNYIKVSIGLNLFGEDHWFVKQKFN